MSTRDAFLSRVRQAVRDGNQAGTRPILPDRDAVGYQGGGERPLDRFQEELKAAGGHAHVVPDPASAAAKVVDIARQCGAMKILLGSNDFLEQLGLARLLQETGAAVIKTGESNEIAWREAFFPADLGITPVHYLIAETGTTVVRSVAGEPRSQSLLPPVHVAVAQESQIVPDLFDLFAAYDQKPLPSSLTLVTGPSKTGDIELRLVTGVHGPGEVHVVVVAS